MNKNKITIKQKKYGIIFSFQKNLFLFLFFCGFVIFTKKMKIKKKRKINEKNENHFVPSHKVNSLVTKPNLKSIINFIFFSNNKQSI